MNSNLFIPKKIRAGFQNREGTYNGTLGYIIYFGPDGKIRKEKSFESWRDKKIPIQEFDNIPTDGFVFNKNVQRYNWSHFGSGRSLIRVYDPRGVEFEITTENLILILMHTDCCKRGLVGSFVYGWSGGDLVLMPVACEEYQKATEFTERQDQRVGMKNMVNGCSYKTKKGKDLVYLGKFDWYVWDTYSNKTRKAKKCHIFTDDDGKSFLPKNDISFLASRNTDEPVSNYADIVENFQKNIHSSKIVKIETVPVQVDFSTKGNTWGPELRKTNYFLKVGNNIMSRNLKTANKSTIQNEKYVYETVGYYIQSGYYGIKPDSVEIIQDDYLLFHDKVKTKEYIESLGLCDLFMTLENGKKIKFNEFRDLN